MKTENLFKACDSFTSFQSELQEAHTDAVNSDNEFAEITLFELLELAAVLRIKLARAKEAARQSA